MLCLQGRAEPISPKVRRHIMIKGKVILDDFLNPCPTEHTGRTKSFSFTVAALFLFCQTMVKPWKQRATYSFKHLKHKKATSRPLTKQSLILNMVYGGIQFKTQK